MQALFLLLAVIRKRHEPTVVPAATYKAQALPSNGIVMLVESLVCDGLWVDHNTSSPLKQLENITQAHGVTLANVDQLLQVFTGNATYNSTCVNASSSMYMLDDRIIHECDVDSVSAGAVAVYLSVAVKPDWKQQHVVHRFVGKFLLLDVTDTLDQVRHSGSISSTRTTQRPWLSRSAISCWSTSQTSP